MKRNPYRLKPFKLTVSVGGTIDGHKVVRHWLEEARSTGPRAKWRRVANDTPRLRYVRVCWELAP